MRLAALTFAALLAFAGNSLLCRMALRTTAIDPASFTALRIASGAVVLWLLARARTREVRPAGDWSSAAWLFAYAAAFSFAYASLSAGTGALLLFGSVQATMIGRGLSNGERLRPLQWIGLVAAFAGLAALVLPGASAPAPLAAALMIVAGIAWGCYSLRGRGAGDPIAVTAGNFLRAAPMAVALNVALIAQAAADPVGIGYAVASGAVTSGLGYAVWYTALRELKATIAAALQLAVPVLAALGGVALLHEPVTLRLTLCSAAILGGVALVVLRREMKR